MVGRQPWSYFMDILEDSDNSADTELLIYTMTLLNKVFAVYSGHWRTCTVNWLSSLSDIELHS